MIYKGYKSIFILLLTLFAVTAQAGDSGLYFSPELDGVGLVMTRQGDTVQFYYYLYEYEQGCWSVEIPETGLVDSDNCHEPSWVFSAGDPINDSDDEVTGWLYIALGLDYPSGLPTVDPFVNIVAEAQLIGLYVLQRNGEGWRMVITRFNEVLPADDPLYTRVHEFPLPLMKGTD